MEFFKLFENRWVDSDIRNLLKPEERGVFIDLFIMCFTFPRSISYLLRNIGCNREILMLVIEKSKELGIIEYRDELIQSLRCDFMYLKSSDDGLRKYIRERDLFTCQRCGVSELQHRNLMHKNLAIHHINYIRNDDNEYNLITLCTFCNSEVNCDKEYWQEIFMNRINAIYSVYAQQGV